MRIQQNYLAIASKVTHFLGCLFLNMHLMELYMSTFTVSFFFFGGKFSLWVITIFSPYWWSKPLCSVSNMTDFYIVDGEGCQLSWFRRMKISLGVARSLRYLHTELHPPFALSELNSGAIYLTEDFTPKVGKYVQLAGSSNTPFWGPYCSLDIQKRPKLINYTFLFYISA